MNILDWIVIVCYLIGMIALSAWLGRRTRDERDYYVAGHDMPWYAPGLSTMATQCSTNSLLGAPAFVVLNGLLWLQYELAVPLAMIFLMWVMLPLFRRLRMISVYEYVEWRFGPATRAVLSIVFQFTRAFSTGITVYGIALVLEVTVGLAFWQAIVILAIVTIIYDILGGIRAVVWSDVIQMGVLLLGIVFAGAALLRMTGGWEGILAAAPPETFQTLDFRGHGLGDNVTFAFWPMLLGGFFLYLAYYGCDQTQVQRELSVRRLADIRWSLFLNGVGRFPLVLAYCGLGVGLAAYLTQHPGLWDVLPTRADGSPDANVLLIAFVLRHLPHGIIGLFVVALFAAAMSSLDSTINSLSATTCRDLIDRFWMPSGRELSLTGNKILTMFWGVVCTGFAFYAGRIADTIIEAVNMISSIMNGPILATFLLAMFTRRTRNGPMALGIVAGFAANLVFWKWVPGVSWIWWNVIGAAVTSATAYGLSWILPGPMYEDTRGVVWKPGVAVREPGDRVRWGWVYAGLALYAVLLLLVLVGIARYAGA